MSPRTTTAFSVPAPLWQTDGVLDALAARDVAQLFRLIQRETRVSQTHLGVATGLSQAQVSEIIAGSRKVSSIDVLTRIATGLCMPPDARATLLLGERAQSATRGVGSSAQTREQVHRALTEQYSDVEAVYPSRSEFTSRMPPHALFDSATDIRAAGLSLNLICQQYADTQLVQLSSITVRGSGCCSLTPPAEPSASARRKKATWPATSAR